MAIQLLYTTRIVVLHLCTYVCLFFVILEKSTFSTSISLRFWIFKYVVCNVVISEFVFKFVNYCFLAQETSREIDEIKVFITDRSVTSVVEFWGFYLKQAAKVSRVDRDIPKSSSSYPQVILKSSNLIQSDPIWSNLIQF